MLNIIKKSFSKIGHGQVVKNLLHGKIGPNLIKSDYFWKIDVYIAMPEELQPGILLLFIYYLINN